MALVPGSWVEKNNLAAAYFDAERYEDALEILDKSLAITGDSVNSSDALFLKANSYKELGNTDSAAQVNARSLELGFSGPLATQARQSGLAYHILGQYDKAIADFNRSIQLQPNINDTAQTYVDRGLAYIGLGQYRSAIQDFDFAIAKARGHFYAGDPMFFPYFFNRGLAYFNLGRYTEAVADLTAALSFKHPDLDEALLIRGISYGLLGQHALAMNDLDEFDKSGVNLVRGLRLNPQVSKVNYTRGLAFLSFGQYQRSIDFFDQAIQLDPDDPIPYISRGLANAHLGRNQQATGDIDQAMEIFEASLSIVDEDRYSANALFLQGRAYQDLGQADSAIKLLTLAVRLHSNDPQAYINRANAYHDMSRYNEAVSDLDQAISLFQDRRDAAQAYVDRGLANVGLGQYRRAIEDFDEAIDLKQGHFYSGAPVFFSYFFSRALAYFNLGLYEMAITDLDSAIRFDHPDIAEAFLIRGISYGVLGKDALAIKDLEQFDKSEAELARGFRLHPQDSKVYSTRGLAFLSLGQYQRSIGFFDQAIRLDPGDPVPYISRGLANAHLGRNRQATRDLDRAMEIFEESLPAVGENRFSAEALFLQGNAYQNLGQADSAIKLLTLAVRLHSNDPQAYINRAKAYHDMSRYNEAVSDLDQAISLFQDRRDAAQAYVDRGLANVGLGQYRIAIEDFDQAIDRKRGHLYSGDPVYFPYFFNRGLAYFNLGSYQMAIRNMDSAIEFDHPDIAEAYLIRGISYGLMSQNALADADLLGLGDAATDLERGFRLNPQDSKVYYTRGLTFFYLGRYQQAIDSFDQAIQLDPNDLLLREGRGLAIAKLAQN